MPQVDINCWATLVAALIPMALGMPWYDPHTPTGKAWGKWMKVDHNDPKTKEEAKKGMPKAMLGMFVSALLMSYILSHFVDYTASTTFSLGMQTGFWLWLGFVATTMASAVFFTKKPWKIFFIDSGFYLVSLVLMGGLLAVWR